MSKRRLVDWAFDNINILSISNLISGEEVYVYLLSKYSIWETCFTVSDDNINEKDYILNTLWQKYVDFNADKINNLIQELNDLNGKNNYFKEIVRSGNTILKPNISTTTTSPSYTEKSESVQNEVAYNTFAEKETSKVTNNITMPEITETRKNTGEEKNERNLKDVENGWNEDKKNLDLVIKLLNFNPIYNLIDNFVKSYFTFFIF